MRDDLENYKKVA
jgi:hypothetical protein